MRSCSETRLTSMPFSLRLLSSRLCRQPITGVIIVERICNSKKKKEKKKVISSSAQAAEQVS